MPSGELVLILIQTVLLLPWAFFMLYIVSHLNSHDGDASPTTPVATTHRRHELTMRKFTIHRHQP